MTQTDQMIPPTTETKTTPRLVGELLPKALGPSEMCAAFGISSQTFRRLHKRGDFRPFELARAIGRKRYSGEKVQAFLNGRADRR